MTMRQKTVLQSAEEWSVRAQAWLLLSKHALYGLSAARILVGVATLGILLTNFRDRHVLWGAGSFWAEPHRDSSEFGFLLGLFQTESTIGFTFGYLVLIGVCAAVILGWRTRPMIVVLVIGMAGLVERADTLGDQGDNIARIGLTLMLFMNVTAHWSLDARRRRRAEGRGDLGVLQKLWHGLSVFPGWITTPLHNVALMALACQIFILYTASALFKVQGDLWQDGTALHYPLSLHEYGVFPWLNSLLTADPFVLTVLTYGSIFVQLFFAVGLLHPVSRRVALLGIIFFHGGIAVLMGLPWFSLAMLAFDAIFVSSRTWRRLALALRRVSARRWSA